MALREVRVMGDPILEKICKPVKLMTPRLEILIDDMLDTMYEANGVGLAAPQVGVLRRIIVIDTGETGEKDGKHSDEENEKSQGSEINSKVQFPLILINPEVVESDGEQTGSEGCLSIPGKVGTVTRPNHVIVKGLNRKMEPIEIEAEELLARAICHEIDHLDGKLYAELAEGPLRNVEEEEEAED